MRTTNPLASLFGKSPFGPIQKHMRIVEQCAEQLIPLFEALHGNDPAGISSCKQTVFRLEQEADELKNEIRSRLPSGLLMPVARRDLIDLLGTQDAIAGAVQDVVGLVSLGRLAVPSAFNDQIMAFVRRVVDATRQCRQAVEALDELLETGFRGRDVDRVLEIVEELDRIETQTDTQAMELLHALLDSESDMDALSVFLWFELIRTMGGVADEAENVGDRLRLLLAH